MDSVKEVPIQALGQLHQVVHRTKDQILSVVAAERATVMVESIQHLWLAMDSEVEVRSRCPCGQSVRLLLR